MAKYIGKRIVPVHCGRWDQNKTYEMLSIVLEETSGDSYISRRAVPSGTAITDDLSGRCIPSIVSKSRICPIS